MPDRSLVSILIPAFNEETQIEALLDKVRAAPLPEGCSRELIIVDDGSTDETVEIVADWAASHSDIARVFTQPSNQGKGAAIRRALAEARGEFCIIQDSDLEYDPADYRRLLKPLIEREADAVYGSRFAASEQRRVLLFWHSVANHALTTLCNMISDLNLTDVMTGYKGRF